MSDFSARPQVGLILGLSSAMGNCPFDFPAYSDNKISMSGMELESKLWDTANYVTGFAIIQGLAFAVAFGTKTEISAAVESVRESDKLRTYISAAVVLGAFFYVCAVCWCHLYFWKDLKFPVFIVMFFQCVLVLVFQCLAALPVIGGMSKFNDHWARRR